MSLSPNNHRAVLKASELGKFLAKLPTKGSGKLTSCAIRWTLLTMVRTKETRYARYDELEGLNGKHPQWRIPASRLKTGIEHIVPLSSQVMRLLSEIKNLSGSSEYIFPSLLSGDEVIGPSRMIECIGRMGYGGKATIHGFRGLASTLLNEATRTDGAGELARLWESDWVERQLAHVESRQSRRAYNAAEWIGPRQRMMQWWGDWVDAQDGKPSYLNMACQVPYQFVY
jgi:integrase